MGQLEYPPYKNIHEYFHSLQESMKIELKHRKIVDNNMVALVTVDYLSSTLFNSFIKDFMSINYGKDRVMLYVDDNHFITIMYRPEDRRCREPLCALYTYREEDYNGQPRALTFCHLHAKK